MEFSGLCFATNLWSALKMECSTSKGLRAIIGEEVGCFFCAEQGREEMAIFFVISVIGDRDMAYGYMGKVTPANSK